VLGGITVRSGGHVVDRGPHPQPRGAACPAEIWGTTAMSGVPGEAGGGACSEVVVRGGVEPPTFRFSVNRATTLWLGKTPCAELAWARMGRDPGYLAAACAAFLTPAAQRT
jgi:hypothetical protein